MLNTIICIDRQFGSGGHEIAVQLGNLLGLTVYDGSLLDLACAYGEVRPQLLKKSDEKATNPYLYATIHEGNENVQRGMPLSEALFSLQSHEIKRIAAQGSCIFVGRCASYILHDEEITLLRIFITAPTEQRIRNVHDLEKCSYRRAKRTVARMDMQYKKYYECFAEVPWGKASLYDIVIDTGNQSISQAAAQIAERYNVLCLRK